MFDAPLPQILLNFCLKSLMRLQKKQSWNIHFTGNLYQCITEKRWFLGVVATNDVIQKIEKTPNNTHTTTHKLTNNSFRNTKKHPIP